MSRALPWFEPVVTPSCCSRAARASDHIFVIDRAVARKYAQVCTVQPDLEATTRGITQFAFRLFGDRRRRGLRKTAFLHPIPVLFRSQFYQLAHFFILQPCNLPILSNSRPARASPSYLPTSQHCHRRHQNLSIIKSSLLGHLPFPPSPISKRTLPRVWFLVALLPSAQHSQDKPLPPAQVDPASLPRHLFTHSSDTAPSSTTLDPPLHLPVFFENPQQRCR